MFFLSIKGSLFSVSPEEEKSYHSLINIAHTSKLTEYSDNIFSLLLHQLLFLLDWSILNILTILNIFGLLTPEE